MSLRSSRPGFLLIAACLFVAFSGLPFPVSASSALLLSGFPTLKQQRPLTCESAAASMATRGAIAETQIMSAIPRNANPHVGFRGNPDGRQGTSLVDYGVYAQPIQAALTHFGYRADLLLPGSRPALEQYVQRGWPVVVWATYALQPGQSRLASAHGVQFVLVTHEHALLLVGYDSRTIYANDPWTGTQVRYRWRDFLHSWGLFSNMAVAVDPCQLPGDVPSARMVSLSSDSVTWSWKPAPRAAHYLVAVRRLGPHPKTVLNVTQDTRTVTLTGPVAGRQYQLEVRALSACGDKSRPFRLVAQLPDVLPTPTPGATQTVTPSPEQTIVLTSTATTVPTASPTPKP